MNQTEQLERIARLIHIDHAVTMILEFTDGQTIDAYRDNILLRLSVERQLITIGEALSRALKVDPSLKSFITDSPHIIACRNQLIHNYPVINDERIWLIIHDDLPLLLSETRALLAASTNAGENPA